MAHALLILYCAVLLRTLAGNRSLYWGDILLYFEPMLGYIQSALHGGRVPLWNPYVLCGQPLLGNPQMGVFYPASLLLTALPVWRTISVACGIHIWLCGAFTFEFLRRWTTRTSSALAGALINMGSGCLLARLQFPPMVFAAAYLPLLLLLVDRSIDRRLSVPSSRLVLAVGLILLAAHPQVAYLSLLTAVLYTFARLNCLIDRRMPFRGRMSQCARLLGPLAAAGAGGVLLAMVQLLPAVQLIFESSREHMTVAQANRFVLQPEQLVTLILPHFVGHPATRDYWGGGNVWEPALFIGWAPVWLVLCAVRDRFAIQPVRFWAAFAGACVWLAFGANGGLYILAFYCVPGVGTFHDPARFLIPGVFSLAALAGLGLDRVQMQGQERAWRAPLWLLLIAGPLAYYAPDWIPTTDARLFREASAPASVRLLNDAGSARTYHPLSDLIWRIRITAGYTDYGDNGRRSMESLLGTRLPDLNVRSRQRSASGYEPVALRGPLQLDGLAQLALRRGEPNFAGLAEVLGVKDVLVPGTVRLGSSLALAPSGSRRYPKNDYRTLQILLAKQRPTSAWIVHHIRRVDGDLRVSAALTLPGFDSCSTAIISDALSSDEMERYKTLLNAPCESPEWSAQSRTTQAIVQESRVGGWIVTTPDASAGGFVVLGMAGYPGWYGTVDGCRTALHRADSGLMGLFVPGGRHVVRIQYSPQCYRIGLYLSLCGLLVLFTRMGAATTAKTLRQMEAKRWR